MRAFLVFLVRVYQKAISPLVPGDHCRYYPSCSDYAIETITRHGPVKGIYLALKRVLRCHPFHEGGFDPAP